MEHLSRSVGILSATSVDKGVCEERIPREAGKKRDYVKVNESIEVDIAGPRPLWGFAPKAIRAALQRMSCTFIKIPVLWKAIKKPDGDLYNMVI